MLANTVMMPFFHYEKNGEKESENKNNRKEKAFLFSFIHYKIPLFNKPNHYRMSCVQMLLTNIPILPYTKGERQ